MDSDSKWIQSWLNCEQMQQFSSPNVPTSLAVSSGYGNSNITPVSSSYFPSNHVFCNNLMDDYVVQPEIGSVSGSVGI